MERRKKVTVFLPRPEFFDDERTVETQRTNPQDSPLFLPHRSGVGKAHLVSDNGWLSFVPAGSSVEVQLHLRGESDPYDAVREWCYRRAASHVRKPRMFDIRKLLPIWNYGSAGMPRAELDGTGYLRFETHHTVPWEHMAAAQKVWVESGRRGTNPIQVLTQLEPDLWIPLVGPRHPDRVPSKNRWAFVSVDLALPLEEQFREAKRLCALAQRNARLLAGMPTERPGRRESRRDVLIYTLSKSAGLTTRQIAGRIFPREERQSAQRKIRLVLKRVQSSLTRGTIKAKP